MNRMLRNLLLAAGVLIAGQAAAQVTFYEHDGFHGRSFTSDRQVLNFDRIGFNDRASSLQVRGGTWQVCEDMRFEGRCVVLRPGNYPSLAAMGLNDKVSSVRPVQHYGENRVAPEYVPGPQARYGNQERYEYRNDGWRYDRQDNRWERY